MLNTSVNKYILTNTNNRMFYPATRDPCERITTVPYLDSSPISKDLMQGTQSPLESLLGHVLLQKLARSGTEWWISTHHPWGAFGMSCSTKPLKIFQYLSVYFPAQLELGTNKHVLQHLPFFKHFNTSFLCLHDLHGKKWHIISSTTLRHATLKTRRSTP